MAIAEPPVTTAERLAAVPSMCQEGKQDEALDLCLSVLDDEPEHPTALYYGGICAHQGYDNNTAISLLCRAYEVQPDAWWVRDVLSAAYGVRGDWDGAAAHARQGMKILPEPLRHSNLIWCLAHRGNTPVSVLADEMRQYGKQWGNGRGMEHPNELTTARRLRVGYVSADLIHHSANMIVAPVIFKHDHDRFEVTVYSGVEKPDDVTEAYQKTVDRWREVHPSKVSTEALVAMIREDQIDILVDLSGHSGGNRLLAFAQKPAPVQVTAWGYVIGTGLREMDYIIGDALSMPKDWCARYLVEKPWHLSSVVSFNSPRSGDIDVTPPPIEANGHITFGYFGRASKVTTETTDLWAKLLVAIPDAQLIIKDWSFNDPPCRERLVNGLVSMGVDLSRIHVRVFPTFRGEHIAQYNDVDVALDAMPSGGGATVLEAAWMGVPTLTLYGDRISSRVSTSIMHTIGEGHWSRVTPDDYVRWGRNIADHPELLSVTRKQLRSALENSIICQAGTYCAEVEAAYAGMWAAYCEGRRAA